MLMELYEKPKVITQVRVHPRGTMNICLVGIHPKVVLVFQMKSKNVKLTVALEEKSEDLQDR